MFKLVISDDEGKTTVVPLVRDEITIGRKEGNTIRLTERNVSRRHARLHRSNGSYQLEDLSSYNGVRINGQRIGEATALKAGDQVAIGDYLIALQSEEVVATPPPAPEKPPPARLVMLTPPAPGAEFALGVGAQRIGRAEDLDIWVNHRSISREHAEVTAHEDGILSIRDLASANGLRVNGEDRSEAEIEPGDVVELGQVRFRYVGAGEKYVFESDRTVQMDAVVLPEEAPASKAPIYVAAVIVLLAVAVGAGIALQGDGTTDNPIAQPITDNGDNGDNDETNAEDQRRNAYALSERCNAALVEGDYESALSDAEAALRISPNSQTATRCRQDAATRLEAVRAFDEGVGFWRDGNAEQAWLRLEGITDENLLEREEYDQVRQAFLEHALDSAEADPTGADEYLASVDRVAVRSEDGEYVERAAVLRRQFRRVVAMNPPPRMTTNPGMRVGMMREVTMSTVVSAAMDSEMATRPSASDVARQCRFDPRCIVEGIPNPRTANEMAQVIEAYRRLNNVGAKRRLMQDFVSRFPNHRNTRGYRGEL